MKCVYFLLISAKAFVKWIICDILWTITRKQNQTMIHFSSTFHALIFCSIYKGRSPISWCIRPNQSRIHSPLLRTCEITKLVLSKLTFVVDIKFWLNWCITCFFQNLRPILHQSRGLFMFWLLWCWRWRRYVGKQAHDKSKSQIERWVIKKMLFKNVSSKRAFSRKLLLQTVFVRCFSKYIFILLFFHSYTL